MTRNEQTLDTCARAPFGGLLCERNALRAEVERQAKRIAELEAVVAEAHGCFTAAETEGWSESVEGGNVERIQDLWVRRLSFAARALEGPK